MNVILFFTYDVSLKDWSDKGLLDRELKIYENISKDYNINFTFVTYGTSEDLKYISKDSDFKVLPIYKYLKKPKSKFFRLLKSLYIPFYVNKITENDYQIIKTNQLYGGWVALIYKFISKTPYWLELVMIYYPSAYMKIKTFLKNWRTTFLLLFP